MGSGQGSSKSSGTTGSPALTATQTDILKTRENQYQTYFFPELTAALKEANQPAQLAQTVQPVVQSINSSFKTAGEQINKDLQRRGLAESGFAPQAGFQLQTARAGSLADAYARATEEQRQRKLQLIQMGGGLSPQATTAVGSTQESKQKGSPALWGLLGNWGN